MTQRTSTAPASYLGRQVRLLDGTNRTGVIVAHNMATGLADLHVDGDVLLDRPACDLQCLPDTRRASYSVGDRVTHVTTGRSGEVIATGRTSRLHHVTCTVRLDDEGSTRTYRVEFLRPAAA
jgi:hypothetical protein